MEVRTSTSQADGHAADAAVDVTLPEVVSRRSANDERYKPTMRASRLRKRLLIASDLATLVAACLAIGLAMTRVWDNSTREALVAALVLSALLLPLWAGFSLVYGLYRRETRRADLTATDDVVPALTILSLSSWAIVLAVTLSGSSIPVSLVVGLWAVSLVLVLAGRVATRSLARQWPQSVENTLIVGAGDIGQLLGRKLAQHPELGLRLVGFADDDPKAMRADLMDVPVLGAPDELEDLVREHDIHRIIMAFSNEPHYRQLELVHQLRRLDVQVDLVPRLFEAIGPVANVHYIEGLPLVALPTERRTSLGRAVKRALDIAGSAFLLVALSPLFLYIAWRVRRSSDGPILFRQERLGERMEPFQLLKFRTMRIDTDDAPHREYVRSIMDTRVSATNNLYKLERTDAVTKFGMWLRRTSLDELPQLINVLCGEMSLVGPRPCLAYECEFFEPHHFDRFLVPAGMTGLWQVTARARATFKEALDFDAAYARDWSLGLDLKLIMQTPGAVLRARRGTA